jgi:hypothetical protein
MRMAGLPRRHQNSVPIWVEVTTVKQCRAISRQGAIWNVASNNP